MASDVVRVKERLSGRHRLLLTGVALLAAAVAIACLGSMLDAAIKFFGEQATDREDAIASQASRTAVWALASPICAWAVLRGGRRAPVAAVAWAALLVLATPWWYPRLPRAASETERPVWATQGSALLWLLVVTGIAIALYAAWRAAGTERRIIVTGAVVVALLSISSAVAVDQGGDELTAFLRGTPSAAGRAELRALQADPLWNTLPRGRIVSVRERGAYTTAFGTEVPTRLHRLAGARGDRELFQQFVRAAEDNAWQFTGSRCSTSPTGWSWAAGYSKPSAVGPAMLELQVGSDYPAGVEVSMAIGDPPSLTTPGQCWISGT